MTTPNITAFFDTHTAVDDMQKTILDQISITFAAVGTSRVAAGGIRPRIFGTDAP